MGAEQSGFVGRTSLLRRESTPAEERSSDNDWEVVERPDEDWEEITETPTATPSEVGHLPCMASFMPLFSRSSVRMLTTGAFSSVCSFKLHSVLPCTQNRPTILMDATQAPPDYWDA